MMMTTTTTRKYACVALCERGYWKQAWALSAVEKGGRDEVARRWGAHLMQRRHPFDALASTRDKVERQCLMWCILQDDAVVLPPSGARMMQSMGDMGDFVTFFREKMATTLKAMGERTPYTYQFVQRLKMMASSSGVKKPNGVVDGEMLRRVFICFENAGAALNFVELWRHAQQLVIGRQQLDKATCLLECGTYDHTLRKWVLDVDASILELKKDPVLWPSSEEDEAVIKQSLHAQTMQMAQNVATVLWKMGYLYRPCHFAVTTRHSAKKMSWHITLCALAPHETWRKALHELEEKYDVVNTLGKMYAFVDKGTKNNSKSQYMQARGSTKVAAGVKADGNFFKDLGLFDGASQPVAIPESRHSILFYAVTSVVIHDPWSIPFRRFCSDTTPLTKKRKAVAVKPEPACKREKKVEVSRVTPIDIAVEGGIEIVPITHWDLVPREESAWMRQLIERSDGSTRLTSIPSMLNPQHWCWDVVTILNAGRGQVKVYAKVEFPVLCPKYLKAKKQVYQHGSTNGMTLMVVEETLAECKFPSFRMFARCFSEKCRHMPSPYCSGGWIELNRADYLLVRVKKEVVSPESTFSTHG